MIKTLQKHWTYKVFIPHSNNNYRPHAIRHVGLFVSLMLILAIQGAYNLSSTGQFKVLGYATNVSAGGLLVDTNNNRSAAGSSSLTINSQLSAAAQAKAKHMADNNYWDHIAPDGTTPWDFIVSSGYSYIKAGENLAFGFATSSDVVEGWMNSQTHRDNLLDPVFTEVGFGIVNASNFQSDENTIVVAMYGQPITVAASQNQTTPQETKPVAQIEPQANKPTNNPEAPAGESKETPEIPNFEITDQRSLLSLSDETIGYSINNPANIVLSDGTSQEITVLSAVLSGQAHWAMYLSLGIIFTLAAIFLSRHLIAIYHFIQKGEHYVEGHPLLEGVLVYGLIWVVLFSTFGVIA